MHHQTMNDRAELMALRAVEILDGAVDVDQISDRQWNSLCMLLGGDIMTLHETREWKKFLRARS